MIPDREIDGPGQQQWDVFVSHSHTDEAAAARIAEALAEHGLSVFRAVGAVDAFTSISDAVMDGLHNSKILLACYSREYPTRQACQHEFATAYLAGDAEGNPLGRVAAVNLEDSVAHIEPRQLRDVLLPVVTSASVSLEPVVQAVTERVQAAKGPIGAVTTDRPVRWLADRPVYPPNSFVGRWKELWWLHSALHPHIGPLTSPPTTPIAVLHGPGGIGKTALAAEYVRRFGGAFPDGIVWVTPNNASTPSGPMDDRHLLWVIDDAAGDPDKVAAMLPTHPGVPSLVLTRDARLSKLGNALALTDLNADESALLIATHSAGHTADPATVREITSATEGSPELRERVAKLAGTVGAEASLHQLHRWPSDLLRPLEDWLALELRTVGETGRDVLRVLCVTSPAVVPILRIADILAALRDSERLREIVPTQQAVTELVARGVLAAAPNAVELALPSALAVALRHLDNNPHHAERIRVATMRSLAQPPESTPEPRSAPIEQKYSEEVQRAAHRIQTELLNRITGHPLEDHQGSLRDALLSLHTLLEITRTAQGDVHPAALRSTPSTLGLGSVANRLINDVLRDLLNYWHIELSAYEDLRPPDVSRIEHERNWPRHDELRRALGAIHQRAMDIAEDLGTITGNEPYPARSPTE